MPEQPERDRVACDENCGAFEEPLWGDIDELRAALTHWRDHGYLSGCSHGR